MASSSTHPPSTSAARSARGVAHSRVHPPAVRGAAHRRPGVCEPVRFRAGGHARPAWLANLPSYQRGHRRPRRGARPPEEHGHRVLRVCGKGTKVALVPLPPAVGRAIDRATGFRDHGPILLNTRGARMDRHAATRRLRHLAEAAGIQIARAHPHMLRHTYVTTMLDAGADLRDVQIAARHADPRAPRCGTTGPATTWTATRTTSWPPTWPPAPDPDMPPAAHAAPGARHCR